MVLLTRRNNYFSDSAVTAEYLKVIDVSVQPNVNASEISFNCLSNRSSRATAILLLPTQNT